MLLSLRPTGLRLKCLRNCPKSSAYSLGSLARSTIESPHGRPKQHADFKKLGVQWMSQKPAPTPETTNTLNRVPHTAMSHMASMPAFVNPCALRGRREDQARGYKNSKLGDVAIKQLSSAVVSSFEYDC